MKPPRLRLPSARLIPFAFASALTPGVLGPCGGPRVPG